MCVLGVWVEMSTATLIWEKTLDHVELVLFVRRVYTADQALGEFVVASGTGWGG